MTKKAAKAKARRSFRVDDGEEISGDEDLQDYADELRTRRSLNRVEDGPVFKSPSKVRSAPSDASGADFFHCLKLAAENKISSKNAFGLQMIDYLGDQVGQKDSAINQNFQLASCSLDAGTKIYAARVDCVAKGVTDFSMVMTMGSKKGGDGDNLDDDNLDNEEDTVQAKKKKIKRLRRHAIFSKGLRELQLDFSKQQQSESVFPIVGNLMHEAVDSFSFTKRSTNGAIKELLPKNLECSEVDKPMKIHLKKFTPDSSLCPTLKKFALEFDLSENANDILNSSMSSLTNSPVISLKEFNESSLEDNPVQEPFNSSFDTLIVEEGRDGCLPMEFRDPSLVADRYSGPMAPKKLIHNGRIIQLQGPAFWKWKRPNFPIQAIKNAVAKRAGPKHVPLDFSAEVDLSKLLKKKTKVTLQRDTLVKWSTDKITMPFEIFEGDADSYDTALDITKFSLMPKELIPNTVALVPVQEEAVDEQRPTDEFFNDELFPVDNEVAPLNDDDSDDENPIAPIDDDGTENFNFDLENLFKNSVISNATRASFMTNIGLDESNLISEPMMCETVIPEWKPARRFNMKKLEAILWEHIELEQEGKRISATPHLHELYESLPAKLQNSASMTTVLYALLNVANKKCIGVNLNLQLDDCQVEHMKRLSKRNSLHPAIHEDSVSEEQ